MHIFDLTKHNLYLLSLWSLAIAFTKNNEHFGFQKAIHKKK